MNEESKIPTPQDMDTVRFFSLVTMFASSAYQGMGKIANPMTGKAERNLDSAQGFIDILIMLKKKTSGNLSETEDKLLDSTLSDLQMNFVQEKAKPEPEEKEEEKVEEEDKGEEKSTEEGVETEADKEETKEDSGDAGPIITPPPTDDEEKKKE